MKRTALAADLPSASTARLPPSQRRDDDEYVLRPPRDLPPRQQEEGHVCAKKWNKGIEHDPDPRYPIVMKPSADCSYDIEGQIAYIGLPAEREWLDLYLSSVKRLSPAEVLAETGVFTWMLYRKGSGDLQFVASKVHTPYEIGTIHYALYEAVGATSAHGAGELRRTSDGKVYVNMASGSFVAKWVGPKDAPCSLLDMQNYIFEKLQPFFPGVDLIRTSSEQTYINIENLPMTLADLQLYADAHFRVCLHPKDQKDVCKKVGSMCENPMPAKRK